MSSDEEFSADQLWLWDLYPLAEDAWPTVSLSRETWSEWFKEPGQTMTLRSWVTGPNGPSFLTEYTPADDYITEGTSGQHDTFNGLYRGSDRVFYIPRSEDLHVLQQFDAQVRPETPNWTSIRVALCQAGHQDIGLAMTKAPVLVGYLCEIVNADGSEKVDLGMPDLDGVNPVPPSDEQEESGIDPANTAGTSQSSDNDEDQYGGPEEDPFDPKVVHWLGKRLYLGPEGAQVRELFMLLSKRLGVPHTLGEVQRAVDGMETYRDQHGEDAFCKSMNRIAKALSKLRSRLRENDLDDHVIILKEGPRDYPSYTLISRFGKS